MSTTISRDYLLDSSALLAMALGGHAHHDACLRWLDGFEARFYTCPITQGALARMTLRSNPKATYHDVLHVLRAIYALPRHRFLPDDASYLDLPERGALGPQQVTDHYLAHLARSHGLRLATLDRAQAANNPDVADLIV